MRNLSKLVRTQIAVGLATMLSFPLGQVAAAAPQQQVPAQLQLAQAVLPQQPSVPSRQDNSQKSSDKSSRTAKTSDGLGLVPSQNTAQNGTPATSESTSQSQQNGTKKPVGTAAAPYEKTTGVAASRPAGAVIAPAKQRRVRSFLIKIGVVAGAGIAFGAVAALSHASPSRPH